MSEVNNQLKQLLTIRVGRSSLSFARLDDDEQTIVYEPYVVKSGVSMAANLREAFKGKSDMLLQTQSPRVRVLLDSNVLMVPIEMFSEQTMEDMHRHAFPGDSQDSISFNVLPDLNAVAVFAMSRDLKLVIDDHFQDVRLITAISPVWRHMHQRSFTGTRYKLYGYFHEKRLEVFSFQKNRFKYCNSFDIARPKDALYFLLFVWRQLLLEPTYDELHIMGDIPNKEWLLDELKQYLEKVYVVNPAVDFQHAPAAEVKGMPYDLMTLFVKGR